MNSYLQQIPFQHDETRRGFALVLALSMMAFVLVIVLVMSTLVTVELRSSKNEMKMNAARANARMGLMLALGELQQNAGSDTRVTAPGDSVAGGDGSHRVTGAWRSWEGLDHDATIGLPGYDGSKDNAATAEQEGSIAPDYSIKTVDYDADNPEEGRFLAWLVSEQGGWSAKKAPLLDERVGSSVPLLASGTLENNTADNEVHVIPTPITANEGSFAWWVSGENQKANLSAPATTPNSNEAWDQRLTSAGQPDATFFGLSTPDELSNAASLDSLDLMSKAADAPEKLGGENFHHLTVHSRGLLTNTATGGWRRDLSLMTEQWDDLPDTGLPFYTIQPGVESSAVKADRDYTTSNHLIYPWAETVTNYRSSGDFQSRKSDAVTSWSGLRDFCVQYKSITSGGANGQVEMPANRGGKPRQNRSVASGDITEIRDQSDRFPVLARMHWVFSYSSKLNPDPDATADNAYIACIVATPVITMWNPYNVTLEAHNMSISDRQMSPLSIKVQVGDRSYPEYPISSYCAMASGGDIRYGKVDTSLEDESGNKTIVFKPGETHVFTPYQGLEDQSGQSGGTIGLTLRSGYRTQQGYRFELSNPDNEQLITGKAGDTFKVVVTAQGRLWRDNTDRDRPSLDGWRLGADIEFQAAATPGGVKRTAAWYNCITNKDSAKTFWPDKDLELRNNDETLENLRGRSDAFAASLFGYRVSNKGNLPSKGVLQCNPVANRSSGDWFTGGGGSGTSTGLGARHPVNWPYDFDFVMLNGWNDPGSPSGTSGQTTGYIGPSHQFSSALDRLVMAHAPLRPIQSLAQLQHLNLRQGNPVGPYQYNIIGNSHAQPLFAPDATLSHRVTVYGGPVKLAFYHQYDDSYIANHLLFDDWFVSSIAPDTQAYQAGEDRSLEVVYEDHLTGKSPLPNHRYLPANPTEDAASQAAEDLTASTAWKPWYHVASKLEVHGMFNVNSTSVKAWTALLRHLKDAEVPAMDRDGSISLDEGDGYPLGRDSLAGEAVAGGGINNSGFTEATEYTGYRRFTDAQIDALARQMVEEIKARGPFLSLSEFINRRLTADPGEENLARAGVIEAALLHLSEQGSSSENPYRELQSIADEVTDLPDGNHDYQFPYAALGSTAYGFPGWTRQADVLRPLAPILSARDDTFTIRAYGDVKDLNGKVVAKAWCEAIVKRSADYVDSTDANTDLPGIGGAEDKSVNSVNQAFGRRFEIVSFRWLSEDEV